MAMVKGVEVPPELQAELLDSAPLLDDPLELRQRLAEDGYLFLPGVLAPAGVKGARAEILGRLEAGGEIEPGSDGRFPCHSRRREMHSDLGAFWQSVSEGP